MLAPLATIASASRDNPCSSKSTAVCCFLAGRKERVTRMSHKGQRKRRHPRLVYDGPVVISRSLGPAAVGRIRNLSEGGLMVEFANQYPSGTLLELVISLAGKSIRAEAKVVWSSASPGQPDSACQHGLEFTYLEPGAKVELKSFIGEVPWG
jgi:hypothetical protein